MIRLTTLAAIALLSFAACQPQKTPEQVAAEQRAAAMQEAAKALGGMMDPNGEIDPEKLTAVIGDAGKMASAMNAELSPEERAKLEAITGAIASGKVHPVASAYLAGADKAFAILGDVKDVAGVNASKPQLAAVYAEMAGPAATLKAMSETDREVAFGSAMTQMIAMSTNAMKLMSKYSYDPEIMQAVSAALDEMPQPE